MEPIIELESLSLNFGKLQVLKELNGALAGRAFGLLGPNGAGKSTLLRTLMGFHKPTSGTARVFGKDIRTHAKTNRQDIGFMPENDAFIADMSAIRFVRMLAELSGMPPRMALEKAHEALHFVGLGEARYRKLGEYSLGMKQKAKLAQALVHGPRLLILDEPTNGLDPPARSSMLKLIREIRDSNKVHVIISSHLLADVEEVCEEVVILKEGRLVVYCNLEQERRANRKFLEMETRGQRQDEFVEKIRELGVEVAQVGRRVIKMVLPENVAIRDLYSLASDREVQIRRLDYKRDSLQDIFLKAMETDNLQKLESSLEEREYVSVQA
ncbi:MAG TPA: ABC transporter ATP-binding protein [Acidobacteriota bacterium]|nr:ABC transporter ATP-binding protein [Acidobacteriota bacterium]